METVEFSPEKEIPVVAEADVLVVGGGPGGVGAAVMSAREGASTVLAEQHGRMGGTATFGEITPMMINHYAADGKLEHGVSMDQPVYTELMERLWSYLPEELRPTAADTNWNSSRFMVSKDLISLAMEDLCLEAGVKLFYHFQLVAAGMENRKIRYAVFHTKSGFVAIRAKNFVDATGDGDLAALSGCRFEYGDTAHGLCQPMTLCFKLSHVDKSRVDRKKVQELYRKAQADGRIECKREDVLMFGYYDDDIVHFNTTRVLGKSAIDALQRSEAELEGRRQMRQFVDWLRSEVPGFEHAMIHSMAAEIGVRESRRIKGRAYLTREDFLKRSKFADAIARCNYPIDIHSVTGAGTECVFMPKSEYYEIPFGCIVAADVDNLTVGGRPISVSHDLHASSRVMPPACTVGQAAGLAAAMASRRGISSSELEGVEVRKRLTELGAWL